MERASRRSAPETHGHLREINRHCAVFTLAREVCARGRIVWEVTVRFRPGHQFLLGSIDGVTGLGESGLGKNGTVSHRAELSLDWT